MSLGTKLVELQNKLKNKVKAFFARESASGITSSG
jgi:hypothetical protein